MKKFSPVLFALALSLCAPALSLAADFFLHTTSVDAIDNSAPTATKAKFKDSAAINRTVYQEIGVWSAGPLAAALQLNSLSELRVWIGLKNSDDQGTYFDLRSEVRKNGAVVAAGETKNIQGVTRNPNLAKEAAVGFSVVSDAQFGAGDILSIRILTKVADSGGHNNAAGLRLYYDAVSRASKFGASFGTAPAKLIVASVNGGANPIAGTPFSAVIQSQTAEGFPANVGSATAVNLTLKTGAGLLGGTLIGTIPVGANQTTINGITYTKAESGVALTASRTSGDPLSAGDSVPFSVNPGAPSALAFTTQPGNVTAGSVIPGPPTIAIRDSFGNQTSSTASLTIGFGANPAGGILGGTTTKSAVSGVVSYNDLSINQAGTGYTLTATAPGLSSATSNPFSITASAAVSMAAIPTTIPVGDSFIVTWGRILNPTSKDWIGLFLAGSSDTSAVIGWWVSCTHAITVPVASGTCSLPIPTFRTPGTYEFRLFTNDTFDRLATSNPVTIGPPSNQNKVTISVGTTVTAGTPGFSVSVQSRTASGAPINVTNNTDITLSLLLGNGVLGGTISGTILAGTNQAVIGPVTYSKAESGVVLTASRTSGDDLRAQNSQPLTVVAGPATQLAFTIQPTNTNVGSAIPGPPTVTVQDNAGNAVPTSTAPISIALGANPGGTTLDNDLSISFESSVAYPSLVINQPGIGYTLIATSPGLQSATSNPFNVTLPGGGGTIAGIITRVSNGTTISGALVEAFEGLTVRGTAVTNSSGNYSITGLATGSYTVRASFIGLVPQMVKNVQVISGSTTNVSLSLNFGIAMQSPVAGAVINDFSVLVTGHFDRSLAAEVGITVNDSVALQDGNEFATLLPIDGQTSTLTATLKDSAGIQLAVDVVPITTQLPDSETNLFFRPSPVITLASQPVSFTLTSVNPFTQVQLDGNGDGTIDYAGDSLQGITITFAEAGLYFPTVYVTELDGTVRTATALVQVLDAIQLDAYLQNKWSGMKTALRQGNVTDAVGHIVIRRRATYEAMLKALTVPLSTIDQVLTSITLLEQRGIEAEYEMLVTDGGVGRSYMVLFAIDEDGIWRVKFF